MGRTLEDVLGNLSAERRSRVEAEGDRLIREEHTLQSLRKAHGLTQSQIAETLGYKQSTISQMEKRADIMLGTLRSYVEAMGGELDLVATFPDRDPVKLDGFQQLARKQLTGTGSQRLA